MQNFSKSLIVMNVTIMNVAIRISYSWHEINSLLKRSGSKKVHNLIQRPKILYHKNYHNTDIESDIVSDIDSDIVSD